MQDRLAALLAALALGSCGGASAPATEPAPADAALRERVRATLGALLDACRGKDLPGVMAMVAYQGPEKPRRYKSPWRPGDPLAEVVATGLCSVFPPSGEPVVLEVGTRPPTRQTASDWTVTVAEIGGVKHFFGFVEVDGALLLGEIQPVSAGREDHGSGGLGSSR